MQNEPAPTVIRYVPADEAAAAHRGAPPHIDLTLPVTVLPEPRASEGHDQPPIRNRAAVAAAVRVIDNGPHFTEDGWTRVKSVPASDQHIRALLAAHPWIEDLAVTADKALGGKTGSGSYIAGGFCLYRMAHPEHPDELWADLCRRLFHGALQPKDPAEAFRAEYFREKPEGPSAGRAERGGMKIQAGAIIRLLQAMTAGKTHPIGRPFYSLTEAFPTP